MSRVRLVTSATVTSPKVVASTPSSPTAVSPSATPPQQQYVFPASGAGSFVVTNKRTTTKRVLFVCRVNRMRSTTAEALYMTTPGVEARSAGVAESASVPVTSQLVHWADIVFVMEPYMREYLLHNFPNAAGSTPILCLHIPDQYPYMDAELINLLTTGISPILGAPQKAHA